MRKLSGEVFTAFSDGLDFPLQSCLNLILLLERCLELEVMLVSALTLRGLLREQCRLLVLVELLFLHEGLIHRLEGLLQAYYFLLVASLHCFEVTLQLPVLVVLVVELLLEQLVGFSQLPQFGLGYSQLLVVVSGLRLQFLVLPV